jgi:hypothetical protein
MIPIPPCLKSSAESQRELNLELAVVVDRVELLRGVMNAVSKPIEDRIMTLPSNDFERVRSFQLLV